MTPTQLVVAITTFAEKTQATDMAQRVIREKVAACAQVDGPIESFYRWENQICQDSEWRLTMKTTTSALARLQERVLGSHPYAQPQWVVLGLVGTTSGYDAWVREAVTQEGTEPV
jgi:periplasmic divalent cation tolerance protein